MRGLLLASILFCGLVATLRYPFAGVLLWQWVSLMNPHRIVWGLLADAPLAAVIAGTTLVALLVSRERKLPPYDSTSAVIFLSWVWMSITSIFALAPGDVVLEYWVQVSKMILFTLISYTLISSERRFDLFVWVVTFSIGFFGMKGGLFTLLTGGSSRVLGPHGTMIEDNNSLGAALLLVHPLLFAIRANQPKPLIRMAVAGLIVLNSFGILFTYSRGTLIGAGAMGCYLWLKSRHKLGAGIGMVAIIVGVLMFAPGQWFERMSTIESYGQDSSAMGRLHAWHIAMTAAETRPMVGGGFKYMLFPYSINPILTQNGVAPLDRPLTAHSIWFEALGEHGVPGLILFIALAIIAWRNCAWVAKLTSRRPEFSWYNIFSRMVQVSLVGYWVSGSFLSMSAYDGYYDVIVLAAALRGLLMRRLASAQVPEAMPSTAPEFRSVFF